MSSPERDGKAAEKDDSAKKSKSSRRRRSTSRSRSRSKSRSASRSPRRKRSRSRSRSYEEEGSRIHIANIDESVSEHDLDEAFGRFGPVKEIWLATYSPYYAFVIFKEKADAEDAMRYLNNTYLRNCKIRVSVALPRRRFRGPPRFQPPRYGGGYGYGGGGYGYRGGGYGGDRYGGGGGYGYRGGGYGGGRGYARRDYDRGRFNNRGREGFRRDSSRSPYRRRSRSPLRRDRRRSRSGSSASSRSR